MGRIAVGGFQHETNTFAPQRATWADFERADAWPGFIRGAELIDAVEGFNIPIAGAVEVLQGLGHELAPLCWCSAPPSSYVEREAYEKSREFKKGQRFRAGIEGRISVLFRGRGMKRCLAEGRERFELLVGAAVFVNNLLIIASLLKRRSSDQRQAA